MTLPFLNQAVMERSRNLGKGLIKVWCLTNQTFSSASYFVGPKILCSRKGRAFKNIQIKIKMHQPSLLPPNYDRSLHVNHFSDSLNYF